MGTFTERLGMEQIVFCVGTIRVVGPARVIPVSSLGAVMAELNDNAAPVMTRKRKRTEAFKPGKSSDQLWHHHQHDRAKGAFSVGVGIGRSSRK